MASRTGTKSFPELFPVRNRRSMLTCRADWPYMRPGAGGSRNRLRGVKRHAGRHAQIPKRCPCRPSRRRHCHDDPPAGQAPGQQALVRPWAGESGSPERARHAAPADRHCGGHRALRLCHRLARHHLLSKLLPASRSHSAGACRQQRVRHLLRRQEPAAGRGRSRHQGCRRVLAQGRWRASRQPTNSSTTRS